MRQRKPREVFDNPEADRAFARRMFNDHHTDLLHVPGVGWHIFDGRRYWRDQTQQIISLAEETIQRIHLDAAHEPSPEHRDALSKLAKDYSKIERVRGALAFLQPTVSMTVERLDAAPFAFNVRNGTIDLKTGELRAHNRADLITRLSPIKYDNTATAPRWLQFLTEIFDGDCELADYVKRLFGYALTADQRHQIITFLWGQGDNGKGVLTRTWLAVAGEYGKAAADTLLMRKYSDAIPADVADLWGARLVIASESQEDGRLDEQRVKALTGSDRIKARFMRQNFFEFEPTHHIFLQTNHKPKIVGQDHAIWRRIRLIPFGVRFEDPHLNPATVHRKDFELEQKLREELPGILRWAVEGAREALNEGLRDPESVMAATKEYRREEDILSDFIESRCVLGPEREATVSDLYGAYKVWCQGEGTRPWSQNRFSRRLTDAGYQSGRDANEGRVRKGIALN